MRLPVRQIKRIEDLRTLVQASLDAHNEEFPCSMSAPPVPPIEIAQRFLGTPGYVTLGCYGPEGRPLIWCTVHQHDGKIIWLCPCIPWDQAAPPQSLDSPYAELVVACQEISDLGECWGEVENEDLHERFLASSAFAHRDGKRSVLRRETRPGAALLPLDKLEAHYQNHPQRRPLWPHEQPQPSRPMGSV
jgi:hypothetical protein